MNFDDLLRDELTRQPPMVVLHNAAQRYAEAMPCPCATGYACKFNCTCHDGYQSGGCDRCDAYGARDCSQYADETAAWGEPQAKQDSEAVELVREMFSVLKRCVDNESSITIRERKWFERANKFLENWNDR